MSDKTPAYLKLKFSSNKMKRKIIILIKSIIKTNKIEKKMGLYKNKAGHKPAKCFVTLFKDPE